MQPQPAAPLTYSDFVRFPEDGRRHELIAGEHRVTPAPATVHQRISGRLCLELALYFRQHPIGEVFAAPFDVVLSDRDVVEPDVIVMLAEQAGVLTPRHVVGAPAIVVEILSAGTRHVDEGAKRALYDRAGVREYWLVDPDHQSIELIRRRAAGAVMRPTRLSVTDALTSPLLPGFSLPLDELFN